MPRRKYIKKPENSPGSLVEGGKRAGHPQEEDGTQ